ncbi:MAG TPA: QueT transporter family protein [Clostridia bacterium]|nr:QueT transporter family protein [Clostridia bacterium]
MNNTTKIICFNAVIAALYIALTMTLAPISYGVIQLRVAESLTILPAALPFSVFGLFIGCAVSNTISMFGIYDVIFGSLITLIAGLLTAKIKNMWLAPLPPIFLNAFGLPLIWYLIGSEAVYWINVLSIFISQTIVLYLIGVPLMVLMKKTVVKKYFADYLSDRS